MQHGAWSRKKYMKYVNLSARRPCNSVSGVSGTHPCLFTFVQHLANELLRQKQARLGTSPCLPEVL